MFNERLIVTLILIRKLSFAAHELYIRKTFQVQLPFGYLYPKTKSRAHTVHLWYNEKLHSAPWWKAVVIHKDSTSNFDELVIKSKSVSVHQKNLQLVLTKLYKTVNNLNPISMAEVFVAKDVPYNLRSSNNLVLPRARSSLYGIDTKP